jgi:pSer/pThr/pTyr-binding forkhead associated (FHA) protein
MPLEAKFVVVGGETKAAEVKLRLPTIIGRGRSSGIMVPHPLVSRQHCEVYEQDGRLMVRDLGSLNGTFVGQEKIADSPLLPDQLLTVGNVTFRAVYDLGPEAASAERPSPKMSETPAGGVAIGTVPATGLSNKTVPAPAKPAPANVGPPPGPVQVDVPEGEAAGEEDDSSADFAAFLKSLEGDEK